MRWLTAAAVLTAASILPALASSPNVSPPATNRGTGALGQLGDDPKLRTELTVSEAGVPVGELLNKLSQELNTRLTARRDVADDKITLFLDKRPAANLLTVLGRHLDFQWRRTPTGYELAQTREAHAREEALREREWRAIQDWMRHLRQLARMPEDQLRRRQREVGDPQPGDVGPAARERAALRDIVRHPAAVPVALEIFNGLTPMQLTQLRKNGSLRLTNVSGGIPPVLAERAIAAIKPSNARNEPLTVDMIFRITDGSRDYEKGGSRGVRRIRMDAYLTVATEHGSSMVNMAPRSLVDVPLPEFRRPAPPALPELEREVTVGFPKPEQPGDIPVVLRDRFAEWTSGTISLGELARQLHETVGIEVVADSFIRARIRPTDFPQKVSARQVLDRAAELLGYSWWCEGKTVFLRSRSYHNDRPAEVPERVIRAFTRRAGGKLAPNLDDLGALALQLTEPQARGIHDYWGWYFAGSAIPSHSFSGGFFRQRHDLRFWGSLNQAQKNWLHSGKVLLADGMDLRQRLHFLNALTEPGEGDWTGHEITRIPVRPLLPSAASVPRSATFRLDKRDVEMQAYETEKGDRITEIRTVGVQGRLGGFGDFRRAPMTPDGEPSPAISLNMVYSLTAEASPGRTTQLYVFGDAAKGP